MSSSKSGYLRMINLGGAIVTIMNIGDINYPLVPMLNASPEELAQRGDLAGLMTQDHLPTLDVHIQLPNASVLVDVGKHDVTAVPRFAIPEYTPPPGLIEQLGQANISPDDIEHVIITHAHWDHINGTTIDADGSYQPLFPNAHYYLGAGDWAQAEESLSNPDSLEYRTLRVLNEYGVLNTVAAEKTVIEGVEVIPTPGETDGHQIVRLHHNGESLYCLGDLYHHVAELLHPELMVKWADTEAMLKSRALLTERAIAENALLTATHIPEVGRLSQGPDGLVWQAVY